MRKFNKGGSSLDSNLIWKQSKKGAGVVRERRGSVMRIICELMIKERLIEERLLRESKSVDKSK